MTINSKALPENILSRMSKADRGGQLTAAEATAKFLSGEEKKLQKLIADYLNMRGIYFESDRMDRKTSGAKGRPDFRICYRGRWLAVECKAGNGKLRPEQAETLERIRKSGGETLVAFSLAEVKAALNAQADTRHE